MECQYCKKVLTTKTSLVAHQKKTKYCLKIQGITNLKHKNKCEFCNNNFTTNGNLTVHLTTCAVKPVIIKLKEEINNWEKKYNKLEKDNIVFQNNANNEWEKKYNEVVIQKDIFEKMALTLAKKPTNTTNIENLHLTVFNKTMYDIKRIVNEKYNKNHLVLGQKGVADFTYNHILKVENESEPPMYVITDKTRGNAKYKKSPTEIVTDNGMQGLTDKLYPSIQSKATEIASTEDIFNNQLLMKGFQNVMNMNRNNSDFRKEMIKLHEDKTYLQNEKDNCDEEYNEFELIENDTQV